MFAEFIKNFTIAEAYGKIVIAKPYKVLSCFVYDWTFAPLKRGQIDKMLIGPSENDVRDVREVGDVRDVRDVLADDAGEKKKSRNPPIRFQRKQDHLRLHYLPEVLKVGRLTRRS